MIAILKRYVTDYNQNIIIILFALMAIISIVLLLFWYINRRRFQQLSHQIPAGVVKNYLDSIIQNSTSLKSSLFRGGGLDLSQGIPSVVPVSGLGGSDVEVDAATREQLNQKIAEVSALKGQLSEKGNLVQDLERQLQAAKASSGGESVDTSAFESKISQQEKEIADLKAQLASAGSSGGGDDAELKAQLDSVTKERDELKERLQEYEIIEDDLANLKRLQQENNQLKAALENAGGAVADVSAPAQEEAPAEPAPVEAEEPAAAPPAEEAPAEPGPDSEPEALAAEEAEEAKEGDPALEGEEKSAEDLLSEFEKMLG